MSALNTNTATGIPLRKEQQSDVLTLVRNLKLRNTGLFNMRARMEWQDRVYQREVNFTQRQKLMQMANQTGDASKVQDVTVPVVMPQIETCLDTLRDIFLSSYPMFPVVSKPEIIDEALAMETVIGEQSTQFGWPAETLSSMRDGLKHNLMAMEVDWEVKKVYAVTNDAAKSVNKGVATEILYSGNKMKRLDTYNLIVDERVLPHEQHTKGEFCGYEEMVSAVQLKQMFAEWDPTCTMNAKEAFNSSLGSGQSANSATGTNYFVPQVNPFALIQASNLQTNGETNWDTYMGLQGSADSPIRYHNSYKLTTIYVRVIPSQLGFTGQNANTVQIFKWVIVNDAVVVYSKRQSNAHNFLPIVVCAPLEDGTGWQAKSLGDNAEPYQAISSALFNSGIESQRRKVYDRIFYDPSRINKQDIDNVSSVARIPIKTEAYGKPVSEAFAVVPYRDDQVASIFATAREVVEMGNIANGQNRVQQGQFQKGNKTRAEFQEVMQNGDSRPRMIALVLEHRFFSAVKTIIKSNTLQYQQQASYTNRKTAQEVKIDPVALRNAALEFKLADGLMPSSQYINMETFQALFNAAGQNPQIAMSHDITGAFFYWLKLQGATWIDDFKIDPNKALQQQAQLTAAQTPPTQPPATP